MSLVAGKPMIQHVLERHRGRVALAVPVVRPGMEAEVEAVARAAGVPARCVLQERPTGMLDAIKTAKADGATEPQLQPVLELQRKAQWRLDFVAAENSMGFHAPQEAASILGEAIDYARQGQIAAQTWRTLPSTQPTTKPANQ
jgi:hypothetical protein